jgi:hypothetical protein
MSPKVSDRAPRFEGRPKREARRFTVGVEDPFSELKAVLPKQLESLNRDGPEVGLSVHACALIE